MAIKKAYTYREVKSGAYDLLDRPFYINRELTKVSLKKL